MRNSWWFIRWFVSHFICILSISTIGVASIGMLSPEIIKYISLIFTRPYLAALIFMYILIAMGVYSATRRSSIYIEIIKKEK